eukprot:COSAG01_NODE_4556_length_4925_cov_2.993369_3_plen_84_part_00
MHGAQVERALRNLFRLRIRLGMLDPPTEVPYYSLHYNTTELQFNPAHVAVAKKAALQAMTVRLLRLLSEVGRSDVCVCVRVCV